VPTAWIKKATRVAQESANTKDLIVNDKNVMLDLETLGTKPGCKILSIGAVEFNAEGLGEQFYIEIDRNKQGGLFEQDQTVKWWGEQSVEAKGTLFAPKDVSIWAALFQFSSWLDGVNPDHPINIWGNGSDFDNVLIQEAYEQSRILKPWSYGRNRCYKTLKRIIKGVEESKFEGVKHNALADAIHQANHCTKLLNKIDAW
jgi:hypothetical protein